MRPHLHEAVHRTAWLTLLLGCGPDRASVQLEHGAIALDIVSAPAALYVTVRDHSAHPDAVIEIVTDASTHVSMQVPRPHRMPLGGTEAAMLMMQVVSVPLGPDGTVRFAPGGNTGVLYGLPRDLAPGDSVAVQLRMASGRLATATVPVVHYAGLEAALAQDAAHGDAETPPTIAAGERLYRAHGCASCHGASGAGDGPVGRTLAPPPRNFRSDQLFKGGADAASIALTLAVGVPAGGSMPLYPHLTNHERTAIARYLISLRESSTTP